MRRINHVKRSFQSKKYTFIIAFIYVRVRINLLKAAYVWSVVLYGSETRIVGKTGEKRLVAFEIRYYISGCLE